MSDKRGEAQAIARLLARAFNEHNQQPGGNTADEATSETMTGHAIRLRYDGRWYVVLVVPDEASPLMRAEWAEYGR